MSAASAYSAAAHFIPAWQDREELRLRRAVFHPLMALSLASRREADFTSRHLVLFPTSVHNDPIIGLQVGARSRSPNARESPERT